MVEPIAVGPFLEPPGLDCGVSAGAAIRGDANHVLRCQCEVASGTKN